MKPDLLRKLNQKNPNKVKELRLENGKLRTLPFDLEKFERLKFLNLYNNRLTELPDFFKNFTKLESLNLSNNKFILFPEILKNCANLKYLNFKGNRVTDLIGIQSLSDSIEKIDLSNNNIGKMRIDYSNFNNLLDINLSDNNIEKFPKSLILEQIKIINLSSNSIHDLPESIKNLKSLKTLDLSYNNITELPEEIGELTELRELNLIGNNIATLPKSFKNLIKLNKLSINGNPIGQPPIEISNQGLKAILNYYLHYGASVRLNEAKLLIVGHGGVGKTYLINKLIKGDSPETTTTEGIDILKWNLPIEDVEQGLIKLNAWDFGGQEIYHSTHQFFLTKRSIYLFVWEARKDEDSISFDYWLNIIQILSNSSPVVVVLNKIDERTKEIDEISLREKFPNIISFIKVSAKSGENIESLTNTIKQNIVNLPHIGDKLPEVWSQVRNELEKLDNNYIDYNKYVEICNNHGLSKTDSQHLSRYFHDLGVFLHFYDNFILKHIVFLKPDWVTNSVYKILDLKEIINGLGKFKLNLVEKKLTTFNSIEQTYIIELMKKFELCFEINNSEYIIPELLKPNLHREIEIPFNEPLSMSYVYDFMPAGIIPRLIVRLKDSLLEDFYWKNGIYIKHNDSIGLITGNKYTRTIKMTVSGDSKAVLLGILKRELDIINLTLNNPYHSTKIQCNCENCSKTDTPFMFEFSYLEKARKHKLKDVRCQDSLLNVNLQNLIGPYDIEYKDSNVDHNYNKESLILHLIEISSRVLERKYSYRFEDLVTDNFTDQLRAIGYSVSDQTRSGRSKKYSGELDIMIRNSRNQPISILEAMNLSSFSLQNKTVIEHLNKLLVDYDTNGLDRNFMMIYSRADNFNQLWNSYQEYIENLSTHELYNPKAKIISHTVKEISNNSNVKILVSQHERNNSLTEVYHYVINIK
ncbi:COR domain-containing protein [Spongiimicrobium salis]|uniref:COR domain-containing protein n=1 Tax=Spongiimicrobium salis TaxID=1667022 RepID=UPI00374C8B84